jgi:N-acetylmuramic acid 6-phosphate etherase
MTLLGKTHGGLMVDVKASNVKLRDRAARIISRLAPCPRDQAFALLDAAGGSVKTAIIMHWHRCDKPQAEHILANQGHRLTPGNPDENLQNRRNRRPHHSGRGIAPGTALSDPAAGWL